MRTTEKRHWQNGHQVRGGWHHTLALSLGNYAVMFNWGELPNGYRRDRLTMKLFKLV